MRLENDIRNLVNFHGSSHKSENLHFNGRLLSKGEMCTEKLCVITPKNDGKFEEELTCTLKNDMRNLTNFETLEGHKICTLVGSFWPKYIMFEPKMELCHELKADAIFKEKLTGGLKNDIRNLINFHASSRKSENLHFDGLVLSKAYKVLDEKVRKSYVSWHWRVIQRKANSWEICIFCGVQ